MAVLDKFRLEGRRALVTGGSRGLGRAMAQAFAEAGADLILVGRDADSLNRACDELQPLGHDIRTIAADLSSGESAERLCDVLLGEHPPIDILVNNVGGRRENIATEDMPLETWQRLIDLNLTSAFVCSKRLGGAMLRAALGPHPQHRFHLRPDRHAQHPRPALRDGQGGAGRLQPRPRRRLGAVRHHRQRHRAGRFPDRRQSPLVPRTPQFSEGGRSAHPDGPPRRAGRDWPAGAVPRQ